MRVAAGGMDVLAVDLAACPSVTAMALKRGSTASLKVISTLEGAAADGAADGRFGGAQPGMGEGGGGRGQDGGGEQQVWSVCMAVSDSTPEQGLAEAVGEEVVERTELQLGG